MGRYLISYLMLHRFFLGLYDAFVYELFGWVSCEANRKKERFHGFSKVELWPVCDSVSNGAQMQNHRGYALLVEILR